jgi:hypothetical protein
MNPKATKFYVRHREGYPETEIQDFARRGFWLMGVELATFEWGDDIDNMTDLGPTVGIAGYIGDVRRALTKIGRPIPENVDYPEQLTEYLGRRIWSSTLSEVQRSIQPLFVKPMEHKAFTGFVWNNDAESRRRIVLQRDDTPVWIAEPVNFVAEYRSFIMHGEILDCRLYKGDWSKAPSRSVVEEAAAKMVPHGPAAFSLDWGVTDDGRTLLVEMNDSFSLGHYGLHPGYVAHMLSARWYEMAGGV